MGVVPRPPFHANNQHPPLYLMDSSDHDLDMTFITPPTSQPQGVASLVPRDLQGTPGSHNSVLKLSSDSMFLPPPPAEALQTWIIAGHLISAVHEEPQAKPSAKARIPPLHHMAASGIAPRIILAFSSTWRLLAGMVSKDPHPSHNANINPVPISTQPRLGAANLVGASQHPPHAPA